MFTGLPTEVGTIKTITKEKQIALTIGSKKILPQLQIGGSISIDGACLTIMQKNKDSFLVTLIPETYNRTAFSRKEKGDEVNLELPLRLGDPLTGGMVSALVDGVGTITEMIQKENSCILTIEPPESLMKYIMPRTGIVINGVGLNTSDVYQTSFDVPLYPYVIGNTTLGKLHVGDQVNLEISSTARYIVPIMENYLSTLAPLVSKRSSGKK